MEPKWLVWARRLQAIAQTGLTYGASPYDLERYQALRQLAAEIMAEHSAEEHARIEALFAEQNGYATPKVGVRAAVFRDDGAILLVRETTDGRWSLPGGWADVNQSAREAVVREVFEESGYEVAVRKLAAVWDRAKHPHPTPRPFHIWKLFFICDLVGGAPQTSIETSEIGFFHEHEIPEDISIGRVLPEQIARMFVHRRCPELPTEYD